VGWGEEGREGRRGQERKGDAFGLSQDVQTPTKGKANKQASCLNHRFKAMVVSDCREFLNAAGVGSLHECPNNGLNLDCQFFGILTSLQIFTCLSP
jgi:hypothetical protein